MLRCRCRAAVRGVLVCIGSERDGCVLTEGVAFEVFFCAINSLTHTLRLVLFVSKLS